MSTRNTLFIILLAAVVSFIVHRPVLQFFFYRDDFALLYKLQHADPFPYPFHFMMLLYSPIYSFFQLNPFGYFLFGLILFISSLVLFALLILLVIPKKYQLVVFSVSLLAYFLSPVGIESAEQMCTYAFNYLAVDLMLAVLIFFVLYTRTSSLRYFIISLFVFMMALELLPQRTFYFAGILFLFDLFNVQRNDTASLRTRIARQIPFIFLFLEYFLIRAPFFESGITGRQVSEVSNYFPRIVDPQVYLYGLYGVVHILIGSVMIVFFPEQAYGGALQNVYMEAASIILAGILSVLLLKRKTWEYRLMAFSLLWMFINNISISITNQPGIPEGYARTVVFVLPAFALFVTGLATFLLKLSPVPRKLLLLLLFLYMTVNYVSVRKFYDEFNTRRSQYVRPFYNQVMSLRPGIPPDAILYFQPPSNAHVRTRLIDMHRVGFYGAETAYAVMYQMPNDSLLFYDSPEDLTAFLTDHPAAAGRVIRFSYDGELVREIVLQ